MPATQISHDFDFEFGTWTVAHRRLRERLTGCADWEHFSGTSQTQPTLGGNGNVETNFLDFPGGAYHAVAIRAFDPESKTWAIWWLSSQNPHQLDVPVIGSFVNGVGTFVANDMLRDQPVLVRFMWLNTNTPSPRWEQALSADEGATWETNWTMDFTRVA